MQIKEKPNSTLRTRPCCIFIYACEVKSSFNDSLDCFLNRLAWFFVMTSERSP